MRLTIADFPLVKAFTVRGMTVERSDDDVSPLSGIVQAQRSADLEAFGRLLRERAEIFWSNYRPNSPPQWRVQNETVATTLTRLADELEAILHPRANAAGEKGGE